MSFGISCTDRFPGTGTGKIDSVSKMIISEFDEWQLPFSCIHVRTATATHFSSRHFSILKKCTAQVTDMCAQVPVKCQHLTDMCVSSSSSSSSSTESATRPGRDSMHATKYSVILFQSRAVRGGTVQFDRRRGSCPGADTQFEWSVNCTGSPVRTGSPV